MKQLFTTIVCTLCTCFGFAQTLTSTESVEYDPLNGRFLASNGSSIIHVDGNGNEVAFVGSAQADYGMEVMNGVLYAIVGNSINGYDLTSGESINSVTIAGASFLNGLANDGVNRLWATDFSAKKIYEINCSVLSSPTSTLVVSNTVTTPNGICYDGVNNRLVFVNWGSNAKIKAVDLSDYSVSTLVDNAGVGNIDGIDHDNNGNFYVSSWTPNRITKWSAAFAVDEIITVAGLSSPADICYAPENDTLAIPNSGNSTIRYVGFGGVNVLEEMNGGDYFVCYPNPMTDNSVVAFDISAAGPVSLRLLDVTGKEILVALDEVLPATKHKVIPQITGLSAGTYYWELTSLGASRTLAVVVQ